MAAFLAPSDTESHVKLHPREHCLKRGEKYLGDLTVQPTPFLEFVQKEEGGQGGKAAKKVWVVEERTADVSRALAQMVLEVITNATDHAERPGTNVKNIWIAMDEVTGRISVKNDGESIEVRMHSQYPDKYLTSVIFSEYMVSSNYDDTKENTGAGRYGEGVKVTNTWSTEFRVDHHDGKAQFTETWSENMGTSSGPKVAKKKRKGTYTEVSFIPDYKRLGITDIAGAIRYLRSFAWHLGAATSAKLTVHLDGVKLPVRGLKDYAKILANNQPSDVAHDEGVGIEVAVIPLRERFPDVIGYANAIPCSEGVHVNLAARQVATALKTTPAMVRGRCTLLVNARVPNPNFAGMTKDRLNNSLKDSKLKWEPAKSFLTKLRGGSVSKAIKEEIEFRENRKAQLEARSAGGGRSARRVNVEGLEDAENAGKKNRSEPTTLILTEGLSAKQFGIAGLSVVGRDNFGIFPLRGKPFNVLSGPLKTVLKNAEVANLLKIMGCDVARAEPYTSTTELRYDRICILADQDGDGDHIAGLVVNIINFFFPEIVKTNPNFVVRFSTPLVRATPKRGAEPPLEFTSESAFEEWWDRLEEKEQAGFQVKYYKGLGTSTPREAKACFAKWDESVVALDFTQQADRELLSDCFHKKGVERRRELIAEPGPPVDYGRESIVGGDFLRGDLILFSKYDNERNIANAIDGLKPSQRKILWVMLTKHASLTKATLKVAQLSGEVAKETHYKHGEDSLNGAIILMAQDHPTSGNSIPLLVPGGMFGDRHGNDAASPRYIFTCMEPVAKALFPAKDVPVLKRAMTEGSPVEPVFFVPVIPFALGNGSFGIGTGWSSRVFSHNPTDLIAWCRAYNAMGAKGAIDTEQLPALVPWIEGVGYATKVGNNWAWRGTYEVIDAKHVRVTSLPLKTNAFPSKKFATRYPHFIRQYSSDIDIDFVIEFEEPFDSFDELADEMTFAKADNMNLWDRNGKLALFPTAADVAEHHAQVRLDLYARRKEHRLAVYRTQITKLNDEYRFVQEIMEQPTLLHNKTKASITEYLTLQGYTPIDDAFDHLFRLTFLSATAEMLEKLKAQAKSNQEDMEALEAMSPHDMWARELDELHQAYGEFEVARANRRANPEESADPSAPKKRKGGNKGKGGGKKGAKKSK